jgi:hypothetical protein
MSITLDYRSWIETQLQTITGLKIYLGATDNNEEYPYVQIVNLGTEGNYQDSHRTRRKYHFQIQLVMSLSPEHLGNTDGETAFWEIADEIIAIFDTRDRRHTGLAADIVTFETTGDPSKEVTAQSTVLVGEFDVYIVRLNE